MTNYDFHLFGFCCCCFKSALSF